MYPQFSVNFYVFWLDGDSFKIISFRLLYNHIVFLFLLTVEDVYVYLFPPGSDV